MAGATVLCPLCGLRQSVPSLREGQSAECARCGERLLSRDTRARHYALAYCLAALILYLPAQIYPVLSMSYLGRYTENTIWSGVVELYRGGMWAVALLVFVASILIPLVKILAMLYLIWASRRRGARSVRRRLSETRLYRMLEIIGPWSMLDVFLVAVLVALVKMGEIARVEAGPGIVAFAALVVVTMLASRSFDPALLWRRDGVERGAADDKETSIL